MTLSRINLSQLKSSQVITSTSVQVQKFTNTYSIAVNTKGKPDEKEPDLDSVIDAMQATLDSLTNKITPELKSNIEKIKNEFREQIDVLGEQVQKFDDETIPQIMKTIGSIENVSLPEVSKNIQNLSKHNAKFWPAGDYCFVNNNKDNVCPEGFGMAFLILNGGEKENVRFTVDFNTTNYMARYNKGSLEVIFCCRQNRKIVKVED